MSNLKPNMIPQAQVVDEVKGLQEQRYKLQVQLEQLTNRLKLIEASLSENGELEGRVARMLTESLTMFEDEWNRRKDYFPDIWLNSLEQTLNVVQPPKKK